MTFENAPVGTEVKFIVNTKDLQKNQNNSYNYDQIVHVAKVGANGKYSIALPTTISAKTISVQVKIDSFEYNPIITSSQNTDSIGERTYTPPISRTVSIYNGGKTITDIELFY